MTPLPNLFVSLCLVRQITGGGSSSTQLDGEGHTSSSWELRASISSPLPSPEFFKSAHLHYGPNTQFYYVQKMDFQSSAESPLLQGIFSTSDVVLMSFLLDICAFEKVPVIFFFMREQRQMYICPLSYKQTLFLLLQEEPTSLGTGHRRRRQSKRHAANTCPLTGGQDCSPLNSIHIGLVGVREETWKQRT